MRIRLTSLILVLTLGSSAFAGIPVQSGEQSCSLDHAMGHMDCCKMALMPGNEVQTATARLCCALNCAKEGTTPTKAARFAPQLQLTLRPYPPVPQALMTSHFGNRLFDSVHGPPGDSHPAYIRNLALLI